MDVLKSHVGGRVRFSIAGHLAEAIEVELTNERREIFRLEHHVFVVGVAVLEHRFLKCFDVSYDDTSSVARPMDRIAVFRSAV